MLNIYNVNTRKIAMIRTIYWENDAVVLIDQRALPTAKGAALPLLICQDYHEVVEAIRTLAVRGAPAIGVAAALGIALGIRKSPPAASRKELEVLFASICADFALARPTAVNLFWAIAKMKRTFAGLLAAAASNGAIKEGILKAALAILAEDVEINKRLGAHGCPLIADGERILTYCNAGALACAAYGTALGILRAAKAAGKNFSVYACETRPVLQGARLTTWELCYEGIETTLICDNMAGALMAAGKIDKIITGADRIARNGDTANKIGTYTLAVLARAHAIPFYIAAPFSTFDFSIESGASIPIEEREGREITHIASRRFAPVGVKTYNPAFDITPAELISAIVTEGGILRFPYREAIAAVGNPVES